MARSHAKIFCSIWEDDDFLALPSSAQRLYLLLISQRKTSMVGCLDLKPARWARLAPDTSIEDIRQAARQLHEARFIVLDEETDELVVRTLVRHDGVRVTANSKLLMGFWGQWEAIESMALRRVVIDHVPDDVWEAKRFKPPVAALEMRRSNPPEPPVPSNGSNRTDPSDESNRRTDSARARVPPSAFRLPGSLSCQSAVTATGGGPYAVDDDRPASAPFERVAAVAKLVGQRDHDEAIVAGVEIPNPKGHLRKCIRSRQRDVALADLVHQHLELTDREIADLVPSWFARGESPRRPALRLVAPATDPDCELCGGNGTYTVDGDGNPDPMGSTAKHCPCKFGERSA